MTRRSQAKVWGMSRLSRIWISPTPCTHRRAARCGPSWFFRPWFDSAVDASANQRRDKQLSALCCVKALAGAEEAHSRLAQLLSLPWSTQGAGGE